MESHFRTGLWRSYIATAALVLSLVMTAGSVHAQAAAEAPRIAEVAAKLDLTAAQEPAFTRILQAHVATTRSLLEKHGVDPSKGRPPMKVMRALRSEMLQNRQNLETELAAVLTPQQLDQFKNLSRERSRR
ncbi:Spy/CpxP family protein refolding chaperone [Roseibium sp. HPY-6]|uniref:Spy/CpxP family protein refolding chaperone n=1 Tax=Roseibium sp. HPY-6 TaxID=3229852 RepID=UPI00339020C7